MSGTPLATIDNYIQSLPPDRLVVDGIGEGLTVASALAAAPMAGGGAKRVALALTSVAEAVRALVGLDGRVDAMYLAPPFAPAEIILRLATAFGADMILSDRTDLRRGGIPVVSPPALPSGARRGAPTLWVLNTSGTTGTPKLVGHTLASLTRTIRIDRARGARTRWGLLYDYTRFAGLQVLLQSVLSGATLIAPSPDALLETRLAMLAGAGCTHLSATPTLWRRILMTPGAERLALQQVTLGGEIADYRVLACLRAVYPEARIAHIFASTEAGVGFSVSDGREGFPAYFLDQPPQGVDIRVVDGKLLLRNRLVHGAYLGTQEKFADADGFVDTGDRVAINGDRYVFLGRDSGVINVGGMKVHPEEVEQVILVHEGVAAVRVSAKRNPITGSLVVAEVVPTTPPVDVAAFCESLRVHCQARLERHKVPTQIRVTSELDINMAGKFSRSGT